MYQFKKLLETKNYSKGKNTCEYIVLHHTASKEWSINSAINTLTKGKVSCHFLCDVNWDLYKIGDPVNIMWHAGVSSWNWKRSMNNYSLGIEIIWPLSDGWFTDAQKAAVRDLVQHLMAVFKIPKERVIRHKDIAPKRKIDVLDTFWNKEFATWADYQKSLTPYQR